MTNYYCYDITPNVYSNTVWTTTQTIDIGTKLYNDIPSQIGYVNYKDYQDKFSINWENGQSSVNVDFTARPSGDLYFNGDLALQFLLNNNVYETFYPDVDYTDGSYIVGTSPYTCPVSGVLILNFNIPTAGTPGYFSLQVNNSQVAYFDDEGIVRNCFSIPVSKGDEIVVNTNATSSVLTIYPYKQQKS